MGLWDRLAGRGAASTLTRPAVAAAATWAQRPPSRRVGSSPSSANPTTSPSWSVRPAVAPRTAARPAWSPPSWSASRATATTATPSGSTSPASRSATSPAPRYHQLVVVLWEQGLAATCWARLTGGWDRGPHDQGSIGLVLDIDPQLRPCGQEVRLPLPAHHRVSVTGEEHSQDTLRALLGRRREASTVGTLRLIDSHPRRPGSGPVVEVQVGGSPMWLTAKMTQRYAPVVQAAADAGITLVCEVVITPGTGKLEAYVRLPSPELMQWGRGVE
jgi:hypothetical protein